MNILLFSENDVSSESSNEKIISVTGSRFKHLTETQAFTVGSSIRVGEINGLCGDGIIRNISHHDITIECYLKKESPKKARAKLILGLPRPKMLRRLLVDITMLGIKDIVLLHTNQVEKSFWQSPLLKPENLREYCLKGLEQACDTVLPTITLEKYFKPFVEDKLKTFNEGKIILAHPSAEKICPQPAAGEFTLIVGPENGFTEYEIQKFIEQDANTYSIGERHLRVETAATYLLGRLL